MEQFKGTKGKWIVDGGDIMCTNRPNGDGDVCIFMSLTTEYENEDLYNKNLISHAPELLDFIKSIVEDYNNGLIDDIEHVAIRAESLYNKATTI